MKQNSYTNISWKIDKTWKGQFGSNHIVPDTVFLRAFKTQELYVRYMKIDKIYLRGQYGSTHIVHLCKDNKGRDVLFLNQNVLDLLENKILCELFVLLIVGKYNIMWTICAFDKNWSNFPNLKISVSLCFLWLEFIKNNLSRKRAIDKNFQRILEKVIRVKLFFLLIRIC